jgi:hypothetical protein
LAGVTECEPPAAPPLAPVVESVWAPEVVVAVLAAAGAPEWLDPALCE